MKSSFILFSALFLLACQPHDNSLKDQNQNARAEGRVNSGNLRVGAYGLPIFTAQNLEQIKVLVADCWQSETDEWVDHRRSSELQEKTCVIRVQDRDGKGVYAAREKWQIKTVARRSDNELVSAYGEILSSLDYGQFKRNLVELEYFDKEFSMFIDPATGNLKLSLQAYGVTRSEQSHLKFDFKLEAEGQEATRGVPQWSFKNITFDMETRDSQNQIKKFRVNSQDLQLSWMSARCAEISGEAETMDVGYEKGKRKIRLSPTKAELAPSQGSSWSQTYQGCNGRQGPVRNFEFMFY